MLPHLSFYLPLLVLVLVVVSAAILPIHGDDEDADWETFKWQFHKSYLNAIDESFHRSVWSESLKQAALYQINNPSAFFGQKFF